MLPFIPMKPYIPLLLIVAALTIAGFSLYGTSGLPRLRALEENLNGQRESNVELFQKVRGLKREVTGLQNDDRVLEKAARNELGMARPGEQVFVFDSTAKQ